MKYDRFLFTAVSIITALLATSSYAALSDFTLHTKYLDNDTTSNTYIPYRLYVPNNYDPSYEYPVMIYLHSSGQTSVDGAATHPNASDMLRWAKNSEHPAIMIVPYARGSYGTHLDLLVDIFTNDLPQQYNIDLDRVYASGWSLGGYGSTWGPVKHPNTFAATAPMAGTVWNVTGADLANVTMWAFTGTSDGNSATSVAAVYPTYQEAWANGGDMLYTEVIGGTHNTTPRKGYAEPGLFPWMFAQRRGQPMDMSMFLAWHEDDDETLNVTGPGQNFTYSKEYFIGYYGTGRMNVSGGASVNTGDSYIAVSAKSQSFVNLDGNGSRWDVDGLLHVGHDYGAKGNLNVGFGTEVEVNGELMVALGSKIELAGGNIHAKTLELHGDLSVDLEQLAQGNQGLIEIDGHARLPGYLKIAPINDLDSVIGKVFPLITYGSKSDTMHDLDIIDLGDDQLIIPTFSSTQLSLAVTYNGDTNADGKVNLLDLVTLGEHYNQTCSGGYLCGDFSGNGGVSLIDLNILAKNYNRTSGSQLQSNEIAIPEPASITVMLLAALVAARRRN